MEDPIQRAKRSLAAGQVRAEEERTAQEAAARRRREDRSRAEVAGYREVLTAAPRHIAQAPVRVLAAAGSLCRLPTAFEVLGTARSSPRGVANGTRCDYGRCDAWLFRYKRRDSGRKQPWELVAVAADGTGAFVPVTGLGDGYQVRRLIRGAQHVTAIAWYVDLVADRSEGAAISPGWEGLAQLIAEQAPFDGGW